MSEARSLPTRSNAITEAERELEHLKGMDRVWIQAVVATRNAAVRERDAMRRTVNRYGKALEEIAKETGTPYATIAQEALDG